MYCCSAVVYKVDFNGFTNFVVVLYRDQTCFSMH